MTDSTAASLSNLMMGPAAAPEPPANRGPRTARADADVDPARDDGRDEPKESFAETFKKVSDAREAPDRDDRTDARPQGEAAKASAKPKAPGKPAGKKKDASADAVAAAAALLGLGDVIRPQAGKALQLTPAKARPAGEVAEGAVVKSIDLAQLLAAARQGKAPGESLADVAARIEAGAAEGDESLKGLLDLARKAAAKAGKTAEVDTDTNPKAAAKADESADVALAGKGDLAAAASEATKPVATAPGEVKPSAGAEAAGQPALSLKQSEAETGGEAATGGEGDGQGLASLLKPARQRLASGEGAAPNGRPFAAALAQAGKDAPAQVELTGSSQSLERPTGPQASSPTATASATATTASFQPTVEQPVSAQLTQFLRTQNAREGQELTLRLNPAELGSVKMVLRSEGGELRLSMEASNPRTLEQMQREAPVLMQRLADSGIEVKRMEFIQSDPGSSDGSFGGLQQQQRGQHGGQSGDEAPGGQTAHASRDAAEAFGRSDDRAGQVSDDSINVWM